MRSLVIRKIRKMVQSEPFEAQLLAFRILRGRLTQDSRVRLLTAIRKAFTEFVFGQNLIFPLFPLCPLTIFF